MISRSSCPTNRPNAAYAAGKLPNNSSPVSPGRRPPTSRRKSPAVVLGCDTVAECEGQILGKPADEMHARRMMQMLSGREHRVLSGLCLWNVPGGDPLVRVAVTRLRMDRLSAVEIDDYLATGLWEGKAGAFGFQDRLGWVHVVDGSPTNVVGLPMEMLAEMLAGVASMT